MVEKSVIRVHDCLSIYVEDEFLKAHIMQFEESKGIKPENIFVDVHTKRDVGFSIMFIIATGTVSQHICLDFSKVDCIDVNKNLGFSEDVRKAVASLNNLVGYVSGRFPGILKKD